MTTPRANELMERIQDLWKQAPVVESLHGRRVKLPGFVVPLDWNNDGSDLNEFLLVPYYGACIHVPPPLPTRPCTCSPRGEDRHLGGLRYGVGQWCARGGAQRE